MKLLSLAAIVLPSLLNPTLSLPTPNNPPPALQLYSLRIYAPTLPYNKRPIVQLHTTGCLGLDNFTVHPATLPVSVAPVQLPDGSYALKFPGDGQEKGAYVSAMTDQTIGTAFLRFVDVSAVSDAQKPPTDLPCLSGEECIADAFSVYQPQSQSPSQDQDQNQDQDHVQAQATHSLSSDSHDNATIFGRLSFEGFPGHWEAVKDAPHNEGWHVEWVGEDGPQDLGAQVEIEIVPVG